MLITKADVQSALGTVLAKTPNPYIDPGLSIGQSDPYRWAMSTCLSGAVLAQLPIGFDLQRPSGGWPRTCLVALGHDVTQDANDYLHKLVAHNDARRNWHDAPRT